MSAPEHTFAEGVLVSGDNIDNYTAGGAISAREPVKLNGNYEVVAATDGDAAIGFAAYTVESGQDVAVIEVGSEVRIEASAALSAGVALTPAGSGQVRQAANTDFTNSLPAEPVIAVANESAGGAGELFEAVVADPEGVRS